MVQSSAFVKCQNKHWEDFLEPDKVLRRAINKAEGEPDI